MNIFQVVIEEKVYKMNNKIIEIQGKIDKKIGENTKKECKMNKIKNCFDCFDRNRML